MPFNLIIHNVGFIFSSLTCVGMITLVFFKDRKKPQNIFFILGTLAVAVFTISHLIGVNVSDHHLSRNILMFNMANIFISLFYAHSVFLLIGQYKAQRIPLMISYVISVLLFVFYLLNPSGFLHDSVPKLYFPNYYVPGPYHWVMRLFSNILLPLYFLGVLIAAYRTAGQELKNRLKYLLVAFLLGYAIGSTAILLVFDIPFDPMWASFFVFIFGIPFTYAVLKFNLLDITIVAKRAFLYSLLVLAGGTVISLISYSQNIILQNFPRFPSWLFSLGISLIAVIVSVLVWRSIRETETLKHEFVNIVTHKFRTPLTHIKWAAESLLQKEKEITKKQNLTDIQTSVFRLNELTNLLAGISESENRVFLYRSETVDFSAYVKEILDSYAEHFQKKHLQLKSSLGEHLVARVDATRINFAFQILLDNAVNYTPNGGTITVTLWQEADKTICKIEDSGVGITKEELPHMFEQFYRGKEPRLLDTEGMGIGLYLVKQIIERHGGSIHAESEGLGKGTAFLFSVPSK